MHRANVYDTLTKLKEKNLIYSTVKEGRRVFVPLDCNLILQEQKEKIEKVKTALDFLQKAFKINETSPKVYVLEGIESIKNVFFSLLEIQEPIWVYGLADKDETLKLLNDRSLRNFHLERISKKIPIKYLFYSYLTDKIKEINKFKLAEARIIPENRQTKRTHISQILCGKKLYLTIWIDPIYTIVIENELITKEYTEFYTFLWDYCEKVK